MNTNNYQPQSFQEKTSPRSEYKEPILRRLATVAQSLHIMSGVVGNLERDLPGYSPVPDMAGTFISTYVKGPIPSEKVAKQDSEPALPRVQLTSQEVKHFVNVGGHYTIAEMEARLAQRQAISQPIEMSEEQIQDTVESGMRDIYAVLDAQPQDKDMATTSRETIDSIVTEEAPRGINELEEFLKNNATENV